MADAVPGRRFVHLFQWGRAVPYAEVAISPDLPLRGTFSYHIPAGMPVTAGDVVLAPFGRRQLPAIVLSVTEQLTYTGETRDLLCPGEPALLPHQLALAQWLAHEYQARVAACVALMLPPAAFERFREAVRWCGAAVSEELSPADRRIAARIQRSGVAQMAALRRSFGGEVDAAVARLEGLGLAVRRMLLPPPAPVTPGAEPPSPPPPLAPAQAAAVAAIAGSMERQLGMTYLLHGVTGSGKTEVYLAAIAAAERLGRRALLLVPEIALTPQTTARVEGRFPGRVAIAHSGLTAAQRARWWHEVRAGRACVVVGARSAVFAPQPELGLIILDEEHEASYKQYDPAPRYHARAVALQLAALTGATVVLGSATPDVVSYWHAEQGAYDLLLLPDRVGPPTDDAARSSPSMPAISVVDLAAELRAGNRTIFSRALDRALHETLRAGEQAILFLNRRGAASFVLCRDCGHVPRCTACLVPYTYHSGVERLRCHHCNRARAAPVDCPQCASPRIRYLGLGTQRVEEEVRSRFPAARVLRWDRDVARTAADHERLLGMFAGREADVLVGTQMIAKGLDLPGVTLVGVVTADIALNLPDYRAGERAFQLLTQVAGRAGRGAQPGRVIIQTYAPQHYAVQAAARHDYISLYYAEIRQRQRAGYPPFGRLARLLYSHTNAQRAEEEARRLARELAEQRRLRGLPGVEIIGPAPAAFERLKGRWRWHLILRAAQPGELLAAVELPRGWSVDIDPASFA